jgi:hypothetical protein
MVKHIKPYGNCKQVEPYRIAINRNTPAASSLYYCYPGELGEGDALWIGFESTLPWSATQTFDGPSAFAQSFAFSGTRSAVVLGNIASDAHRKPLQSSFSPFYRGSSDLFNTVTVAVRIGELSIYSGRHNGGELDASFLVNLHSSPENTFSSAEWDAVVPIFSVDFSTLTPLPEPSGFVPVLIGLTAISVRLLLSRVSRFVYEICHPYRSLQSGQERFPQHLTIVVKSLN